MSDKYNPKLVGGNKMNRQNFQTVAWFNDLHMRQLLNLDPPYQRRSVWNQIYKDYFIDTLLLKYPSPAIYLYEEINSQGLAKYHVVDGKQRLITIFEFVKGKYPVSDEAEITELREKYFDELSSEVKSTFWGYSFYVEYLNTTNESIINNIFDRINKNVARLTPQELRHAKFFGLFIEAAENLSDWMFKLLDNNFPRIGPQSKRRMKDVELVAQLLLLLEVGPKGYSKDELDNAFNDRDIEWEQNDNIIDSFKNTIKEIKTILRKDEDNILINSRFKNQADFYSVFGVLSEFDNENKSPKITILVEKLKLFISLIDNEVERNNNTDLEKYYEYARTASNRTTARRERIRILKNFIM